MACIVMAYIVMTYILMAYGLHSSDLYRSGLYSYGLYVYGLHSYPIFTPFHRYDLKDVWFAEPGSAALLSGAALRFQNAMGQT